MLKGLIFCHECGHPLAVINRKNAAGEDRVYFVCRTYQRFTKAGVCSCRTAREQMVTDAVIDKVQEICLAYLHPDRLQSIAAEDQVVGGMNEAVLQCFANDDVAMLMAA